MTTSLSPGFRLQVIAAFVAVYVIWGSTYLGIRVAIETLPPFSMAGVRFLIAGVILYGVARLRGASPPSRDHWRGALLVGAFLFLGGNGLVVWAEQTVPSGLTALLIATEPLWVVILAWMGRESIRPTRATVTGIAFGLAGVALLVGWGIGDPEATVHPIGAVALVIASASWARGSLIARDVLSPRSPALLAGMQMMCGGALLLLAGTVTGEWSGFALGAVSARSWIAFAYLLLIGSLVAFTAYSWLVRNVSPSRASTYAFVNPVVAVFLGWAILGELITLRTIAATVVIVTGVVLIVRSERSPRIPRSPRRIARLPRVDLDREQPCHP